MLWFSWQMASANVRIVQATVLYHYAHMQLPSIKLQQLETYLKWLVTKHRKTGGVSYSSAVTNGMARGRGRKPNQALRKRGETRKHPATDNVKMFPRLGLTEDRQSYPQAFAQSTTFSESIFQFNNNGQANYLKEQPCMSAPTLGQSISLLIPISQPMRTKQRIPISQPMPIPTHSPTTVQSCWLIFAPTNAY